MIKPPSPARHSAAMNNILWKQFNRNSILASLLIHISFELFWIHKVKKSIIIIKKIYIYFFLYKKLYYIIFLYSYTQFMILST